MAHRLMQDPDELGWERSDFPIVCETCLGPNPYVRMQRMEHGAECHISGRPYTKFRWRPGSDARYKSTIICQEVAKAKNVCQVCLLDLDYNLPVQVRDQALAESGVEIENLPQSDVGKEFALNHMAQQGLLESSYAKEKDNDTILRLQRTTPYYQRNKAQICSFFVRGECKRGAECPYRHEMPTSGPLAEQNIKDRYFGVNDPVANKMFDRLANQTKVEPPEDGTITTLYIGGITPSMSEDDIRSPFLPHGEVQSVRKLEARHCAFVTFADRAGAEKAADALAGKLYIQGQRCRLLWGRPQSERAPGGTGAPRPAMLPPQVQVQREAAPIGADAAVPAGGGAPGGASQPQPAAASGPGSIASAAPANFFALPPGLMAGAPPPGAPLYPSMDPQMLGTRGNPALKRPAPGGPPQQQQQQEGGGPPKQQRMMAPPPGAFPPPGMMRPPPGVMPPPMFGLMPPMGAFPPRPMGMMPPGSGPPPHMAAPGGPPPPMSRPPANPPPVNPPTA